MAKSILSNEKECWFCGSTRALHRHHIFSGVANRKLSEKYGCWVYLCPFHHNMSDCSVHASREMDLDLKRACQLEMEKGMSRERFREIFGKSWL